MDVGLLENKRYDPMPSVEGASVASGLDRAAEVFVGVRPHLIEIAYAFLGNWSETADVVQEAWFRWQTPWSRAKAPSGGRTHRRGGRRALIGPVGSSDRMVRPCLTEEDAAEMRHLFACCPGTLYVGLVLRRAEESP